jgi:pimeloyl-ACP methyl ester carboxylesterase
MTTTVPQTGYAPVNGLDLYYEIHGSGRPLILLHGGFGATEMFEPLLPALTAKGRVIAVDLQGHGRTADIARPLSNEAMADDIAALIAHLGLGTATVAGYSFGGAVALQTAIRHPALVERLVVISTPHKRSAWFADNLAAMEQMGAHSAEPMKQTPLYELYARIAPRPEDWTNLWAKMGDKLRQDHDWSDGVAGLTMPTLLVFGDADSVSPARAAEFFALLGGGQRDGSWDRSGVTPHRLAILPGTTHYDIFASPLLAITIASFLDEAAPGVR